MSRDRINQYQREWRAKNPEKVRASCKAWRDKNPTYHLKENDRRRALSEKKYGVTYPTWWLCDGCCKPISWFKGEICLDHNHETGKFRAWLCMRCNTGLGVLDYLKDWQLERLLGLKI